MSLVGVHHDKALYQKGCAHESEQSRRFWLLCHAEASVCVEELPLELAKWKQIYMLFTFESTWFLLDLVLGSTIICKLHKQPNVCGNHLS